MPGSNYLSKELASAKNKFTSNMSHSLGSGSASSREEEDSWNKERAYLLSALAGADGTGTTQGNG